MNNTVALDSSWFSWGLQQPWFAWGIGLILVFPLLIVALGEIIQRLENQESPWATPVKNIRHLVLPQLVIMLILIKVMGITGDSVWVRINVTLFWVFVIHVSLSMLNLMIFSGINDTTGWRAKIPKLVIDFARAVLVILGAALVLSYVWGLELGRLLTALGVGSIVIGLALQDTLGSLFSGVALISSRQFKVGDWLYVGDKEEGKVISMNWRTVTLLTRDEDIIIVPNSELAKGKFMNYSFPYPRHMERVKFDFSFDDAPHVIKKALTEAALSTPGVLSDPAPKVALLSYDEFSVSHEVQYFIADYIHQPSIRDSFMSRIWYVAKRHGITFPTRAHEIIMYDAKQASASSVEDQCKKHLHKVSFLKSKNSAINEIATTAQLLDYGTGEEIIIQGSKADYLYIVVSGKALEFFIDSQGKKHDMNTLSQSDFFALKPLIRREPSDITAIALTDMQVIGITQEATYRLMEHFPELAAEMEQVIENRAHQVQLLKESSKQHSQNPESFKGSDKIVDMRRFLGT